VRAPAQAGRHRSDWLDRPASVQAARPRGIVENTQTGIAAARRSNMRTHGGAAANATRGRSICGETE